MPKRRTKRSTAKSRKDAEQDKKLSKLMSLVDTQKKQLDTYYNFRSICQPAGHPAAGQPVGVLAVSLLEGVGPALIEGGTATGVFQEGNTKKNRSDQKIKIDNLHLQLRLQANAGSSASNDQQVCVAVIRSKDYSPYAGGISANLSPTGNAQAGVSGPCDNLLIDITQSNPTVGDGVMLNATQEGLITIYGNAPPNESFGPFQFMNPLWNTVSKSHYDVLYFKRHKLSKITDQSSRFGTIGYKQFSINLKKKLKGLQVEYGNQDPAVDGAWQIAENNVYLLMWSDQTSNYPSCDVISRLKFYD